MGPGLAIVVAAVGHRAEVIVAVAVERGVHAGFVVGAGANAGHPFVLRQSVINALPGIAAVAAHVQAAVIGACVEEAEFLRTLVEGGDGAEGHISLAATRREVVADGFEGIAPVEAAVHLIAAHVENVLVVRTELHGGLPVPAQGALAELVLGGHVFAVAGFGIQAEIITKLIAGVDGLVVAGIYGHLHAVATHDAFPGVLALGLPLGIDLAGVCGHPYAVVLQAAIHAVGLGVVVGDGVKLSHGGRIAFGPVLSVIIGDVHPAVVAQNEVARAIRIAPQGMMIHVHIFTDDAAPVGPAVFAHQNGHPHDVEAVGIFGIYLNLAEIIAIAIVDIVEVVFVGFGPGLPLVGAFVDFRAHHRRIEEQRVGIFEVFHQGARFDFALFHHFAHRLIIVALGEAIGPQKIRDAVFFQAQKARLGHFAQLVFGQLLLLIRLFRAAIVIVQHGVKRPIGVLGQADAPRTLAVGKAATGRADASPGAAAVGAAVDARARAAFGEVPGAAGTLPGGGVEEFGVLWIGDKGNGPSVGVDRERIGPGGTTVGGEVDAPLGVGRIEMAEHRYPNRIRISGVHHHAADVVRLG